MTDERQPSGGAPPGIPDAAPASVSGWPPAAHQRASGGNGATQAAAPDLDAGAPVLLAPEERHGNGRILSLLALLAALLLGIAYFVLAGTGRHALPPATQGERITVAAAPRLAFPARRASASPTPGALPGPSAAAIPLVAPRPLPPLPAAGAAPPPGMHVPTLAERRSAGHDVLVGGAPPGAVAPPALPPAVASAMATVAPAPVRAAAARRLAHANSVMPRGTFIRCVLETRVVSDIPGFTSCTVTERVYSFDGTRLLLPQGTRLQGSYDKDSGGNRMAVIWDRILTPDGIDVDMASPGTDPLGGAGVPGERNAHWGSRIGSALLISLLSDAFKYAAAEHGPRSTTVGYGVVTQQPFESNTAQAIQDLSRQAVREAANRPPTVTIRQGTLISVYVARDVDFSAVLAGR